MQLQKEKLLINIFCVINGKFTTLFGNKQIFIKKLSFLLIIVKNSLDGNSKWKV